MPSKKAKTGIMIPPYLTCPQVTKMLGLDQSTIQKRVKAGKYPGSYKPGGRTTVILIPAHHFPEEQIRAFLKKERAQSGD
jgi:predicted DNA-binding transcriptional regulator AlpA